MKLNYEKIVDYFLRASLRIISSILRTLSEVKQKRKEQNRSRDFEVRKLKEILSTPSVNFLEDSDEDYFSPSRWYNKQ